MKKVIAVAASLLVNLGVVVAFEQSAQDAAPPGEVVVTDLNVAADIERAQAALWNADSRAVAL